ncbi:GntR family transcriptional regulator [Sphingomonas sp. AP4-R1]|uniref:GntR family transcriptional regulator n=1 Tax=Sphingomonas sp. AP4-R1 TaxID=2735134 RepID=UPI001493DD5E|nr:GntR family transcriptional regulator [Sphingomonas sp. AP4-R1]QJU60607.1 GntR family transcriptional regulator [Sphingomonas sp. AP4-R1]
MALVIRNLSSQIVELVRDRILSGSVAGDGPIRQDALAAELGVSKIPLREALGRLEQEGLVRSETNRGFFVRTLNAEEVEEAYEARLALEPDVVGIAALRATDGEQRLAIATCDALNQTTEMGVGVSAFNRSFHLALIRPSRQSIRISILERLHVLSEVYMRKHLEPLRRDGRANEEHHSLLQAWLARDQVKTADLMHAHINQTLLDFRQQLSRHAGKTKSMGMP